MGEKTQKDDPERPRSIIDMILDVIFTIIGPNYKQLLKWLRKWRKVILWAIVPVGLVVIAVILWLVIHQPLEIVDPRSGQVVLIITAPRKCRVVTKSPYPVAGTARQGGYFAAIVQDPEGMYYLQDEPRKVDAGSLPPYSLHFGQPKGNSNEFVVHFAFYRDEKAWPPELANRPLYSLLPAGLPRSAAPGDDILYGSIKVKVRF